MLALYVAALGYLYTQQQKLEYHPKANLDEPASVGLVDVQRINIDTRDDQHLVAWYKKPQPLHPTILYFHGNTGNLADLKSRIGLLTDRGDGLLAVDYRGFGASSGAPTEAGLILDGEAAYEALLAREIGLKHIVIYGHSLGSGVAVAVAARHRVAALVLEAPFTSAADVAQAQYWEFPVRTLMRDQFHSDQRIGAVQSPILILHDVGDPTVPYRFGQKLFELAPEPKTFLKVPVTSHDVLLTAGVNDQVQAWLAAHVPLAPDDPTGTGAGSPDTLE
ncbi:MAG: alpha/beta hydrolase [Hyphomicrobiales bacterium]|nr:alpha/beta hydrolase [Hyphomicrobiales bacterium]MDE2115562.1 alpha/beta hydrolase [Hyphomicrobiales bacterium]